MKSVNGVRVKDGTKTDDEKDGKTASTKARSGASNKAVKPVTSADVKGDSDAGDASRKG